MIGPSDKFTGAATKNVKTRSQRCQCSPDHAAISQFLGEHFDVTIDRAALPTEALEKLRSSSFDVVLVNRKLDADYSDGLEIVKSIKADPDLASMPVMLVSNFADAQTEAIQCGAEQGFGKSELDSPDVVKRLGKFLND